jgi:hypothetical protein
MIASLVSMYEKGAITADHLAVQCIHMIDPEDPGLVLGDLPDSLLDRVLTYAREYQPGRMLSTYGPLPTTDQVEAARAWIEARRRDPDSSDRGGGSPIPEPLTRRT